MDNIDEEVVARSFPTERARERYEQSGDKMPVQVEVMEQDPLQEWLDITEPMDALRAIRNAATRGEIGPVLITRQGDGYVVRFNVDPDRVENGEPIEDNPPGEVFEVVGDGEFLEDLEDWR